MSSAKLQTINIRKEYPGTVALDDVSIEFEGGKVHALIGKNGAGKSTLIKILAGSEQPTHGRILVDGHEVKLYSPMDAFNKGIATVYQELSLVPHLTVAENILLGRLPRGTGARSFVIDWPDVFRRAEALLNSMQVDIDVRMEAAELGVAQQQIVEIAKAMSFNPSVLMLDEPTSALAQHETENLFKLIKKLAQRGVAIIYITHRMQELHNIADIVTVLRDGKYVDTIEIKDATSERVAQMMFGEAVSKHKPAQFTASKEPLMEIRNLGRAGKFSNVNFTLYKGEILGIAGLLGSGRTELLRAIFGAEPFDEGEIVLGGKSIRTSNPVTMKSLGVAFTPENRKEDALVQILSIRENMCMAGLNRISTRGIITKAMERKVVNKLISQLDIKISDMEFSVASLSGGSQQKVVVGNWLNINPRIILFDEPTRGIDVQAKQHIFQIMWDLSRQEIGSVFVSSELEELIEVCHRIIVIKKGRVVREVLPGNISTDKLFVMCMEE